jgi:hypothetical protein
MSLGRSEVTEPLFDDRGERTSKPKSSRLDAALGFEQFGINTFYNGIPTLDNASDWFRWNQKVNEFINQSLALSNVGIPL